MSTPQGWPSERIPPPPYKPTIVDALRDRFDGAGYGMFLFVIAAFTYFIGDAHGLPIAVFCCLLMLAVLELGYRLVMRS